MCLLSVLISWLWRWQGATLPVYRALPPRTPHMAVKPKHASSWQPGRLSSSSCTGAWGHLRERGACLDQQNLVSASDSARTHSLRVVGVQVHGGLCVSAVFHFNQQGQVTRLTTHDRPRQGLCCCCAGCRCMEDPKDLLLLERGGGPTSATRAKLRRLAQAPPCRACSEAPEPSSMI